MNNELKLLMDLQEMDKVTDRLALDLGELPLKIQGIQARIRQGQESLEQDKKALTALQLRKKDKEIEVSTQEQKIKKNEMDLNTVKSNEAYKGLLTEIEAAKKIKAGMEDEILNIMVETDRLNAELKKMEIEAKASRQQMETEIKKMEEEIDRVKALREEEIKKRENFSAQFPKDVLARYEYIRNKKKDVAIVAIRGETCGGCNTILTQSIINEARKSKDVVLCESCARILFYPEPAEAKSPAPTTAA